MLTRTQDNEEIIERVAALDIGKAELTCCVRVPDEDHRGRRLQEVETYSTMTRPLPGMSGRLACLGVTRQLLRPLRGAVVPPPQRDRTHSRTAPCGGDAASTALARPPMLERLRRDQTMITANCSRSTRGRRCVIVYAQRFYFFFTVTVHFGDALVVYLPRHS